MDADLVIAGAGLAGACAALALSGTRRVVVLDDGAPGASHAAAGLVNPFMGRKAKRAWRADAALGALAETVREADRPDLFHPAGLLRPARDAAQADVFRRRAGEHPEALDWLAPPESARRFSEVRAPHGALWVREGGHVEIPRLVRALLAEARRRGADVVRARLAGWTDEPGAPLALSLSRGKNPQGPETIRTRRLLLCTGDGTRDLAPDLPFHRIKGQTVRLAVGAGVMLPPVAGPVYAVPVASGEAVVGATFEHRFATLAPTPEASETLRHRAAALVPALEGAEILEARAGVRLGVPERARPGRLPVVGPLAASPDVWVFAGLGAKGLLTAPLIARHLAAWMDAPDAIWPEVSTRGLATPPPTKNP